MSFDDGDGGSYSPGPHHHHSYSPSPSHNHHPPSHFEPHPIPLYAPPYPIIAPFPPGRDLDHRRPRSTYSRPSSSNPRSRSRHSPDKQHHRSRSRSYSSDRDRARDHKEKDHHKLDKAKHALTSSFSHTSSGLGVGVLGAIVGGLAAREASEHVGGEHHHKGKKTNTHQQLISTIVGAAVGGLGANAIEKRLEVSRRKTGLLQEEWERKFGDGDGGRGRDVETARRGSRGSRGSRYYESESESEREGGRRSGERRR